LLSTAISPACHHRRANDIGWGRAAWVIDAPSAGKERPPVEVATDLLRYGEAAGLDAFQDNFHGNRDLDQLLQSMECFMREVKPRLA
jgi:hypothetical protein